MRRTAILTINPNTPVGIHTEYDHLTVQKFSLLLFEEICAIVGLSIILDTIIKKFDRRKPFEGTHRTVVCST